MTVTDSLFCSRAASGASLFTFTITFTTQLNKTAEMCKHFQNSPTGSSFVELSFKVITLPDATQVDKTVLLGWIGSGTLKTQLNKKS